MQILLSIKPEFAEKIFSGEKKFEYRKVIFRNQDVIKVLVYSTMPIGRIIGEFTIKQVLKGTPESLWEQTWSYAGVDKTFYDLYFSNKKYGFAIEITNPILYAQPLMLKEVTTSPTPPQSFFYVI